METEDRILNLLDEAIRLEMSVSDLYFLYSEIFAEDKKFWWQLCIEEKNHASLLRSVMETRDTLFSTNIFPEQMIYDNLDAMKTAIKEIKEKIKQFGNTPPSRDGAFQYALKLEQSAGELHYQKFMTKKSDSRIVAIFQKLNDGDIDHAQRIHAQWKKNT
ncbi:MAG: hypothetical protein JW969_14500 [Spirochaetales bacterium]|nr:hypothetical protein [Spirochaetales bacterium]